MNMLPFSFGPYLTGVQDPSVSHYATFDFGWSLIYPYDTGLEDVAVSGHCRFRIRGLPTPPGPCNPFSFDVISLGIMLQRWVRHIEDIVPDIGPFFDSMVDSDTTQSFITRQALLHFLDIRSRLSLSQLDSLVTGRFWDEGHSDGDGEEQVGSGDDGERRGADVWMNKQDIVYEDFDLRASPPLSVEQLDTD
ncbi:hypothetical protein BDQ12DRAFT_726921 [Crucibulum laeve]|uniref:Uncharacterized protein n=1 Tax=Crucibulum laeve TaxID=68775 RepID=A0A5C3LQV1_9AGAR|nr:hypothetical protein BDQ12DRAFT_726921 [Crucibulum laeve]